MEKVHARAKKGGRERKKKKKKDRGVAMIFSRYKRERAEHLRERDGVSESH